MDIQKYILNKQIIYMMDHTQHLIFFHHNMKYEL